MRAMRTREGRRGTCVHQSPLKMAWLPDVRETNRRICVNVLVGEVAGISRKRTRRQGDDEAGTEWQKKHRKSQVWISGVLEADRSHEMVLEQPTLH